MPIFSLLSPVASGMKDVPLKATVNAEFVVRNSPQVAFDANGYLVQARGTSRHD